MRPTPTQRLAEVLLGRPLAEYVAERRFNGMSWGLIAFDLDDDTKGQVSVSRETLRLWYGADTRRTTASPENVEEPKVRQCCGCSCEVCVNGHNSARPMGGHSTGCFQRFIASENVEEPK